MNPHYDTLLVIDTGTWSQLPGLKQRLEHFKGTKIVIDHHLTQEDWADVKLVDTAAAAAGEIVAALLSRWEVPLDRPMATALFLALVSDTGWFMYSNTRPETLRLAARLMEAGVDTDRIYQLLYQNERAERIALHARALGSLELLAEGKLAVLTIGPEDLAATRAHVNDTENLINLPLQIRTVEVCMLIVEPPAPAPPAPALIRVSLRSKGQVDVAAFAQQFGGGGHARAAGLKLPGPLNAVKASVITALAAALAGR